MVFNTTPRGSCPFFSLVQLGTLNDYSSVGLIPLRIHRYLDGWSLSTGTTLIPLWVASTQFNGSIFSIPAINSHFRKYTQMGLMISSIPQRWYPLANNHPLSKGRVP